MSLGGLRWLLVVLVLMWGGIWESPVWAAEEIPAATAPAACIPRVLAVTAARANAEATTHGSAVDASLDRPDQGWISVTLPNDWSRSWPGHQGAVWYRIDWERGCVDSTMAPMPVALGIDGISMAGAVYSNGDLLWRDTSLVEPLSRSWNMPRWWVLPESGLHAGVNTVWVRAVGVVELSPGLGHLRLGSPAAVQETHASRTWRQRTVYVITASLSTAVGCLFLVVWAMRRSEHAYGWYALM